MAQISIVTTKEEQDIVLEALKPLSKKTVAVSVIAKAAGINQNRVRYILSDLVEAGKVKRIPTKVFNDRYRRYAYEVLV